MAVTVNSGTEGKAHGRMEGMVTHRSPPPRWLLHSQWGVDHTPVDTTELKTQTAQRGWGTDGWKPTTAEAADTFTARYTGRIGQEHKGQVTGNKRGQQPHQTRSGLVGTGVKELRSHTFPEPHLIQSHGLFYNVKF